MPRLPPQRKEPRVGLEGEAMNLREMAEYLLERLLSMQQRVRDLTGRLDV